MPKVSWSAFLERLPAAHLIVGVLPENEAATSNARPQLNLMAALIGRLAPKGLYALSIDRQGRTPEIHCVFEKDADAFKLANAVQADRAGRYPGLAQPAHVHARYHRLSRNRRRPEGALGHGASIERTTSTEIPGHAAPGQRGAPLPLPDVRPLG
jgi:hypothetical protein